MDLQPQVSFIPKKPLTSGASAVSGASSLLWLVSVFIFAISVIAAIAVFGYGRYLQYRIQSDQSSLASAQAAYDPSSIQDLIRLNSRINEAGRLLRQHIAPSAIFSFLESNTLSTARFNQFEYDTNPDGSVSLKLGGNAVDFASVALQSDQFGAATNVLKNVIFSNVNIDPTSGIVGFQVAADFNPAALLYSAGLAASGASQCPTSGAAAATSSTDSSQSGVPAPIPPTQ